MSDPNRPVTAEDIVGAVKGACERNHTPLSSDAIADAVVDMKDVIAGLKTAEEKTHAFDLQKALRDTVATYEHDNGGPYLPNPVPGTSFCADANKEARGKRF